MFDASLLCVDLLNLNILPSVTHSCVKCLNKKTRYLLQVLFVSPSSPDQDQNINKKYDKNKKEDSNISSFKHRTKTIHYGAEVDRVWRHIHH